MVALLAWKVRVNVLKRGLLCTISGCAVYSLTAISAFSRVGKIDWTASDCLWWSIYDNADAAFSSVPE